MNNPTPEEPYPPKKEGTRNIVIGYKADLVKVSRPKSFPEPLPGVDLSLGTQSAGILLESAFQGTGVVGGLRVQCKRSRSSTQKLRLKP